MITYQNNIVVFLDGKRCGEIREVDGGYQYFPKGATRFAGEVCLTVQEVKDRLEED